ncbi:MULTISPECIES: hypothetical protein [Microbacterium]|uniref:hypothetical protein n=1 Tax=Microbacterium TaxID=33882 RepID=UPI003450BC02
MNRGWRSTGGRAATDAEVQEAKRLAEVARHQLPFVRAAATNWRNSVGLGGVLALVLTTVAAPDAVAQLDAQARFNTGWLLGIGALLTFVSLALAMYSSFGWVRPAAVGRTGTLRAWEEREVRISGWFLSISMILAVVALVALSWSVGVMVFDVPPPFDFPGWDSAPGSSPDGAKAPSE